MMEEGDEQNGKRKETCTTNEKSAKKGRVFYFCEVCEKMFGAPSLLATHMRIHTNEKPYKCDVCEKTFRQAGHLKSHKRMHTNEKPFECRVCEKRYRYANSLKYHTRTQHY